MADDPAYASVNAELLAKLNAWRNNVIADQGVSRDFRAIDVFPSSCPVSKVDDWVAANGDNYNFNRYGWPAWYPTRTLEEWEKARAAWAPYVFRGPSDNIPRPQVVHSEKKANKEAK